ncbi:hypothetical protein DQK91_22060 [Oceanidesulfovibrio marinus]|uniref:Uncharacterized protein n=2 Tax=Oceanidesulfovibrio marinus TaxID=370038 RepID=A0A6P1ZAC2_9BACT|nr:hypothetical protein DQK91_22060 [Oceanidesulfovibrio marinus]
MRAMEKGFDLKLIVSLSSGQYLGDFGVVLTQVAEVFLDAFADGPWFGLSNSATFNVGNKLTTKIRKWDQKAVGI